MLDIYCSMDMKAHPLLIQYRYADAENIDQLIDQKIILER